MPDWRNPDDYTYCDSLDLHGWAWEFLRRSEIYRQAWEDYSRDVAAGGSPTIDNPAFRAASLPFELTKPVDPSQSALAALGKLHWNPSVTIGSGVLEGWDCLPPGHGEWPGYPHTLVYAFDLRFPVVSQIKEATRILRSCERQLTEENRLASLRKHVPKRRARTRNYPLYIRLLDADLAGVNVNQMGRHLEKKWIDTHRALLVAREMAAGGYKGLLGKPPAPTSK